MKINLPRFCNAALLGAALIIPVALTPTAVRAQTARSYHDKEHNDDHQWNNHEDQAYKMYAKENHRKATQLRQAERERSASLLGLASRSFGRDFEDQYSLRQF